MNKEKNALPIGQPKLPKLSPGGYKILAYFKRSCAYRIRGRWRFLGFRGCIGEPMLLSLLEKGIAEWGDSGPHAQIRITEAGRLASRLSKPAAARSPNRPKYG